MTDKIKIITRILVIADITSSIIYLRVSHVLNSNYIFTVRALPLYCTSLPCGLSR